MTGFFSSLFGGRGDVPPPSRRLDHPRDLRAGDILQFRFLPMEELSGKRFQVAAVNTYFFHNRGYPECTLEGEDGRRLFLSVDEEDDGVKLVVSRTIKRKEVGELFDLDAFAHLFDEVKDGPVRLTRIAEPAIFAGWTDSRYHLAVDALKGSYVKGDHRGTGGFRPTGEGLDYYQLEGENEEHTVEIEVYDGGETEVSLSLVLPVSAIEEMWPGS